jgi:uncharacterized delta-60 repeat protein
MTINTNPTFSSGDGVVTGDFTPGRSSTVTNFAVQADGRIVVSGGSYNGTNYDFSLARLEADGKLDTSFGYNGTMWTSIAGNDLALDMVIDPDSEKILQVGFKTNGDYRDIVLARYTTDGMLDASFGVAGRTQLRYYGGFDGANAVALLDDGKIVVCGSASGGPGKNVDVALYRFNSDGSFDTSFKGGWTRDDTRNDYARDIEALSDGKLLVGGHGGAVGASAPFDFSLARYNRDGTLDTTFGTGGRVVVDLGGSEYAYDMTVQTDGKILMAGHSDVGLIRSFAVVRYNADGSLDTGFGTGGKVVTSVGDGGRASGQSVVVQPDGKILVSGSCYDTGPSGGIIDSDFAVVRYNADGTLDTSFGVGGKAIVDFPSKLGFANNLVLLENGKILVGGTINSQFGVVRLNPDGSLDLSFDGVNTLDGHPTFIEGGAAVVLDGDVAIADAELSAGGSYAGASLMLERSGGASPDDVFGASGTLSSLTQGGALVIGGTTVGTVTQNSGGTLVLTFGAGATQALVNEVLRKITYANTDHTPPANVTIDWSFSDGNAGSQGTGGALATKGSTTVTIVPTDGGEAKDDAFATDELTPVLGNVFDNNGSGTDANLDGFTITAVNGVAAAVGKQITLASGALLTLKADGTFAYDPNGSLEWLPAAGSGASNLTGSDSFTYELSKGSTATVTITASGVDNDDILQGVSGVADTLKGGAGDDQYIVRDASDLIVELAGNGFDRIGASTSYFLAAGVEIEVLTTTSQGSTAAINLTGNALAQTIRGNAGSNVLSDGGMGAADTLVGFGGNDTYVVFNTGDVIVEAAGSGSDRVAAAVDYKLAAGVSVELMHTTSVNGTASIDLTGNELAQKITGNAGNNILDDGGKGAGDILIGLGGNDTYIVYNGTSTVQEAVGGGMDQVKAGATFALTAGAEVETLSTLSFDEVRNMNLVGNEFAQVVQGNAGVNLLDGRGGNDVLTGGGGKDYFAFGTKLGAGNVDVITDFVAIDDTIRLDHSIFKTLAVSATLAASAFRANASGLAEDADDRIIYETDTGKLYYDVNGSAGGGIVHFATLTGNPTITNADFMVI